MTTLEEILQEENRNLKSVNAQYASQILKSGEELDKTKKHNSDLFFTVERYRNEAAMLRRQLVKAQGRWQRQQRHVHMLHARVDTLQGIIDRNLTKTSVTQTPVDAGQDSINKYLDPTIKDPNITAVAKPTLSTRPINMAMDIAQRLQVDPELRSAVMYLIKN